MNESSLPIEPDPAADPPPASLLRKEIVPFVASFLALIAATLVLDVVLHGAGLAWVGRWLGIPGTLLIVVSFAYSLRKRRWIRAGKPRTLLRAHEVLAWLGALMVLVHAGMHISTVLPWLAVGAMLVNVGSGLTGTWLLERSRRHLAHARETHARQGLDPAAIERVLFRDALSFDLMKRWRAVHMPLTWVFAVLASAHILSIFVFWSWR